MKLLLATTNQHKIREIRPVLTNVPLDVITLADLPPLPEPDEPAEAFWENARHKALSYARATGLHVVAEDSGLEIAALDGAPGVRSARFLGAGVPYATRFAEIERRLARVPGREARFVAALAFVTPDRVLFETVAWIDGEITHAPAGNHGFGYDPIFLYPPFGKTLGEATIEEKIAVSHRARAFRDLAHWLRAHLAGATP